MSKPEFCVWYGISYTSIFTNLSVSLFTYVFKENIFKANQNRFNMNMALSLSFVKVYFLSFFFFLTKTDKNP